MPAQDKTFLQTFERLYQPAEQAVAEIAGGSLSGRQMHALRGVIHALADEAASAHAAGQR
jgi:hypothetical protein